MKDNTNYLINQFAQDVKIGLSSFPKYLSFKDFYDKEGSRIFQEIMQLADYYPTKCEYEIFSTQKEAILKALPISFDLVELGAGDGLKTKVLLKYFLAQNIDFQYMPVDISLDILKELNSNLAMEMPSLKVNCLHDDYFEALKKMSNLSEKPKVILFLGGNIGNFSPNQAVAFLKQVKVALNPNDLILIGIDLVKDPETILKAYTDKDGIHASFNYNLLKRINKELGANFIIENFKHYSNYLPQTGERGSYLISKQDQTVWIDALQMEILFEAHESVFMAISQKYRPTQIKEIAIETGFKLVENFTDSKKYFINTLWKAI